MEFKHLEFRLHAVQRMFERDVSADDVRQVMRTGKVVENYPEDKPFPSCLMLGRVGNRPLHVVLAVDRSTDRAIVITIYEPDPRLWESGFERRKLK